jgi:hypothetical protein
MVSSSSARSAPPGKACHKQAIFVDRIQKALGVSLGETRCYIVETSEMGRVMGKHGWNQDDSRGVVGFQVGNDIYVLRQASWSVLHELVHKAGINADRLSRYVAEGLTEAISADLRQSADEHQPTYPEETRWVRETLLPLLGLTPIQLGQVLAKSDDPPRKLAEMIVAKRPDLSRSALVDELRPQRTGRPSFNRTPSATSGWAVGVGAAFLTAGALLLFAPSGQDPV